MFGELLVMVGKMRELRRNRDLTRPQFEAVQLEKFRKLVRHANMHSAYYADLIKTRGIHIETCTPVDFPVLTKSILMANFDRIVTDPKVSKDDITAFLSRSTDPNDLYLNRYRLMHTSGTSGEVGYFLYSPTDWARGLAFGGGRRRGGSLRGRRRNGAKGRFRLAFYGATGGHFAGVTAMSAINKGVARLLVRVETFEVNSPLAQTIEELNAFQPDILTGYTTALKMLGERQRDGVLRISPFAIGATGETVTQADMAFLSDAFGGAEVSSAYGCTEHLGLGVSDPGGATMTLNDAELIFEFHKDHSVITNLFNYTMPLIRYRMSDILRPIARTDPNSRALVIEALVGRTERLATFTTRDGGTDFLSPHTINEIFVAGVTRFQMHLIGPTSFRFLVCLDPALDETGRAEAVDGVERRLQEILDQKQMAGVTFEVEVVDDVPVNPRTRKFQLIVDERVPTAA